MASNSESPRLFGENDLRDYFQRGNKPSDRLRVGVEHEKFGFCSGTTQLIDFEMIQTLFVELQERYSWRASYEGELVIALTRKGETITLEPGGQFEWSGTPFASLHDAFAEFWEHRDELLIIGRDIGIDWLALGHNPITPLDRIPDMKKQRYEIMKRYMPTRGSRALEMMTRTCTVQANFDWSDEEDGTDKFRTAMAVSPIITAIFANSPISEGRLNGAMSDRYLIWLDTDPDRCGLLEFAFRDDFRFADYLEYALDVPMLFVVRDGRYREMTDTTFRRYLAAGGHRGCEPTLADWEVHLSTIFTEIRLKHYLEVRGADSVPGAAAMALPTIWKGLLYDETARRAAWECVRSLSFAQRQQMVRAVGVSGLRATVAGLSIHELAIELLRLADEGLSRLNVRSAAGLTESVYLDSIRDWVASGASPAEELIAIWREERGEPLRLIERFRQ
ncbi:MAG: glutamate--cysteine ligase [Myxococcales bacterium]|nr:glutamate--cysteine ligase [Myxococcales bacterium]